MSKRAGLAALGLGGAALLGLWLVGLTGNSGPAPAGPRAVPLRPPGTGALVERLRQTRLLNGDEIDHRLGLGSDTSPFDRPEPALRWYASRLENSEVCGVRFVGSDPVEYRLETFPGPESAREAGHVITHRHHCGACSSLQNLAVYLAKPDLTSPARTCARRLTAGGVKACFMEEVGFDERCAEIWAENALHTRRRCAATCIGHYGLWNVLTDNISAPNTDEYGNLNPCLVCDERTSGPGFQYAAGRTRRNSGLVSAIARPADEIYPVDHRLYFR